MLPVLIVTATLAIGGELHFEKQRIGDTTYEACSIFDVNNNGILDIVSGEYWFPGPDFTTKHKICDVMPSDDYYDDFADFPMDVNGNGYLDIVTGAWFGKALLWRENPMGQPVEWKVHTIAEVGNVERPCFWDIDGDGYLDIAPNTPGNPQRIFKLLRDNGGNPTAEFLQHTISDVQTGHGLGFGDINGDGRGDLIIQSGWFEAPEKPFEQEWTYHPEFELYGSAGVPILVHDVNGDGLNDIIVGAGHEYGLAWWEQRRNDDGTREWIKHEIETDRSQFHEMTLADITNDGKPELITGKRWRAHLGRDPGADEPLGLYYYTIENGIFSRHVIDYGPPETASGTGIYLWVADIDGNGWLDVLAPGKEGMYLFRNQGFKNP